MIGSQSSWDKQIKTVLKILCDGWILILDFLLQILQSHTLEFTKHLLCKAHTKEALTRQTAFR